LCDTGPRITPSALLAASSARSESVLPSARSAASPIDMGVKDRANPKARSAAASTFMVAAVISGPMPSPSITTMRTGANDGALTSFPPPLVASRLSDHILRRHAPALGGAPSNLGGCGRISVDGPARGSSGQSSLRRLGRVSL
jgi:hypothetical protein